MYKGDDGEDDNLENDKTLEDGNDRKNGKNEKSGDDIWSTDFEVREE